LECDLHFGVFPNDNDIASDRCSFEDIPADGEEILSHALDGIACELVSRETSNVDPLVLRVCSKEPVWRLRHSAGRSRAESVFLREFAYYRKMF